MARARKTGYTGTEWRQIFRNCVETCKVKAHRGEEKFQTCMSQCLHSHE